MARSFSNAKFLVDEISNVVFRRGYSSAAAPGVVSHVNKASSITKKTGEVETHAMSPKDAPWVPDPVTGHYRPENQAIEIDPAELRAMLLKKK